LSKTASPEARFEANAPACEEREEREAGANRSFYNLYESNHVLVLKRLSDYSQDEIGDSTSIKSL
jgi:hypothetical protein